MYMTPFHKFGHKLSFTWKVLRKCMYDALNDALNVALESKLLKYSPRRDAIFMSYIKSSHQELTPQALGIKNLCPLS